MNQGGVPMEYVDKVDEDAVVAELRRTRCPEATIAAATKDHRQWHEWRFNRSELGTIGDQDKVTLQVITVAAAHPGRLKWMETPQGAKSKATHQHFLGMLERGEDIGAIVI